MYEAMQHTLRDSLLLLDGGGGEDEVTEMIVYRYGAKTLAYVDEFLDDRTKIDKILEQIGSSGGIRQFLDLLDFLGAETADAKIILQI